MAAISFAFSVHHFVSSVGADAGFAAIIGLAILVLLYFAQARETASLREQAFESEQRVQQLEGRLAHLARTQGTAAPGAAAAQQRPAVAPPPAAARAVANPVVSAAAAATPAAGAVPTPPAGMAAPALSAATRLIPASGGEAGASPSPGEAGAAPSPGAPGPATVAAGAGAGSGAMAPGPATVAASGARSQSDEQPDDLTVMGAPAVEADTNGSHAEPPVTAAASPRPPRQAPPPARLRSSVPYDQSGRRPPPVRGVRGDQPRSLARRILPLLIGVAAVAAIVVVLLALTSGGPSNKSSRTSSAANSNAPTPQTRAKPAAFNPSSVTVAVLNGTATSGLARRVAAKLGGAGYKQGTVATATDQTRTATVVAYLPGRKRDALAVASTLKLGSASVQAIDPNTQAVACPPGNACAAGVVVTVGSDLSNIQ